jgi:hypothetical protein
MNVFALIISLVASINLPIPNAYVGNPDHPVPVIFVEPTEINTYCGRAAGTLVRIACEKGGTLILPNPCDYPEARNVDSYAHLVCHEKAHVNGWIHP